MKLCIFCEWNAPDMRYYPCCSDKCYRGWKKAKRNGTM